MFCNQFFFPEFRRFLQVMEESRQQWQATTAEAQRLQRELDKCAQERSEFETKLLHARRLLETESKARRAAEMERDHLVNIFKIFDICMEYILNQLHIQLKFSTHICKHMHSRNKH